MADGKAGGAAAETAVGEEGAFLPQVDGLQVGSRIQHFLHAGAAAGTFVGDDDDVAALHLSAQDAVTGRFLGIEDLRRAGELPDGSIDTGRLHDAAVLGDVAAEHSQSAVLRIGVSDGPDAAVLPVGVQLLVIGFLGAHLRRELAGRCAAVELQGLLRHVGRLDGIAVNLFREGHSVHPVKGGIDQTAASQFPQDRDHAAGAVHVLYMICCRIGRHLADARHPTGEFVDIGHREVHAGLLGDGQQVQDRVGGTAHGDIQGHRVQESAAGSDAPGQDALVAVPVILPGVLHDEGRRFLEEFRAVDVGGQDRPVAREGQADSFGETVHRVGREHAGAAAAARAGARLDLRHFLIGEGVVSRQDHCVDQVQLPVAHHTGFHRTAGNKNGRNVQAHSRHEHSGRNLVAIADTHHRVGLMGIHHILHAVSDDFA